MEDKGGEQVEHLKELVQVHEVCWEVEATKSSTTAGETLQVGYTVLLAGIFKDPSRASYSMRDKSELVLKALRELAVDLGEHAGLPEEHRLQPFDEGIQESSVREHRLESRLKLALLHREGFHVATDDKLAQSLRLLEGRLKELGASKVRWKKD